MANLKGDDHWAHGTRESSVSPAIQQDDGSHFRTRRPFSSAGELHKPIHSSYAAILRCASAPPVLRLGNSIQAGQNENHPGEGQHDTGANFDDLHSNTPRAPFDLNLVNDWPTVPEASRFRHQKLADGRATPPLSIGNGPYAFHGALSAVHAAKTDLFVTLTRRRNDAAPKDATLNLATGQRLVLAQIQRRLIRYAHNTVTASDERVAACEVKDFEDELSRYCKEPTQTGRRVCFGKMADFYRQCLARL